MQRDLKIGLSLGVMLLGVVGAFLFRKDADPHLQPQKLKSAKLLDERIAERTRTPYMTGGLEFEEDPFLQEQVPGTSSPLGDRPAGFAPPGWLTAEDDPFASRTAQPHRVNSAPQPEFLDVIPLAQPERDTAPRTTTGMPANTVSATQTTHVIAAGDTLSTIAQKYLGSQAKYHEIYAANRDVLPDPDSLPLGKTLVIPLPGSSATTATVSANRVPEAIAPPSRSFASDAPVTANRARNLQALTGEEPAGRDPFLAQDLRDDEIELPAITPGGTTPRSSNRPATGATNSAPQPITPPAGNPGRKFLPASRPPFNRGAGWSPANKPNTPATPSSTRGGLGQRSYQVQPGDSLEKISVQLYGTPRRARDIFLANQKILATPHSLREGQTLALPE